MMDQADIREIEAALDAIVQALQPMGPDYERSLVLRSVKAIRDLVSIYKEEDA